MIVTGGVKMTCNEVEKRDDEFEAVMIMHDARVTSPAVSPLSLPPSG